MGRKRKYENAADRLRAFRARAKLDVKGQLPSPTAPLRVPKRVSRPARLVAMETEAQALMDEYQSWRDNLPESLQESGLASKLDDAIDKLCEVAATLADIDLPKGFGRD